MTDKEKAQAYDEALERARKQKYDYQKEFDKTDKNSQLAEILRAGISAIELAFPELAESEDERIRKGLIELIENWNYPQELFTTKRNIIGYLEKQKEQKPADDEAKAIAYREYERGRESGLRDGQKYVLDNAESYGLCKPAEWSKEDNIGWDEAFACVTLAEKAAKNEEELQNAVTAEKWLKEIKFKYYVHPVKQEWSEEDEKIRRNLMSLLANMRGDRITEETYQKYYSWLKSLRPAKDCSDCAKHLEGYISGRSAAENKLLEQFGALVTPEGELHIKPRWKPSKEQIGELNYAYCELFKRQDVGHNILGPLQNLIDALRKL